MDKSCWAFWYSAERKNSIWTALDFIFLWRCNLFRTQFRQLRRPKIITPKPSTVWVRVKNHWKPGRVLFDFGVRLMVRFCLEQSHCHFSLLLLLTEAKLYYLDPVMDHVQISPAFPAFMYSDISLKCFTLFWWYEIPCGRWWEITQERACIMMSPNPQPIVVGLVPPPSPPMPPARLKQLLALLNAILQRLVESVERQVGQSQ
jgi:hypothetical protein